jgi:hypothetical protein
MYTYHYDLDASERYTSTVVSSYFIIKHICSPQKIETTVVGIVICNAQGIFILKGLSHQFEMG